MRVRGQPSCSRTSIRRSDHQRDRGGRCRFTLPVTPEGRWPQSSDPVLAPVQIKGRSKPSVHLQRLKLLKVITLTTSSSRAEEVEEVEEQGAKLACLDSTVQSKQNSDELKQKKNQAHVTFCWPTRTTSAAPCKSHMTVT